MSSEALERAEAISNVLDYCAGNANDEAMVAAASHALRELGALLAEVARLEQELAGGVDAMREVLGQRMRAEAAEAALAVAREREQRAVDALRVLMRYARAVDVQAAEIQGGVDFPGGAG